MISPAHRRRLLLQLTTAASACATLGHSFSPFAPSSASLSAVAAIASFSRGSSTSRRISTRTNTSTNTYVTRYNRHNLSRRMATSSTTATEADQQKGLYLFDFDGVVCDSCDECTVSALRTIKRLGVLPGSGSNEKDDQTPAALPDHRKSSNEKDDQTPAALPDHPPQWLFDKMRDIRPAIEVGWQIPVLLSVFLNQQYDVEQSSDKAKVMMSVDEIIANYEHLVEEWLTKYEKTDRDMIDTFGSIRDDWIATDLPSWLDINTFYPGVAEAIDTCRGEGVLVTTKQQRFAIALCRHAGVNDAALPDDDIYGLGMYKKKADVIVDRMEAGGYSPTETHFFEDRWPTLAKCLDDERMEGVRLYLCSWGYVTEAERKLADAERRVEVIGLEEFARIVGRRGSP